MHALHTLLLSAIVFISACSSTGTKNNNQPDWIDSHSKHYPAQLYLSGQGMADNLNDAKDRARADLAKQFEVAINERSLQQQQYSKQQQGDQSTEKLEQSVSRQLSTQTTRTIQGIEIADSWHDQANHRHYALAVLSRNKARQNFEQQINTLDEKSRQKLKQAESETDSLRKTALVQQAINTQQQRLGIQSALQVVDASGRGKPATTSLAELKRTRDSLINNITLSPETRGTLAQKLQAILSGSVANAGFQVSAASQSDYTLLAEAKLDPPFKQKNWHWLRGTLELRLIDNSNNDIGVQRWPLKAASVTVEQAEQRLLSDIDAILKKELRTTMLGFSGSD